MKSGKIIWITGLSGSGKSTLANALVQRLKLKNEPVVMLDGDELRLLFRKDSTASLGHDRASRLALAQNYARLCQMISSQGVTVVIATISLFKEIHQWNRLNLHDYFEVYLEVPLEELRRRDPKGIYRKFDTGQITDVAGLDLAIDEPTTPDWVDHFVPGRHVDELADELIMNLIERKLLCQ